MFFSTNSYVSNYLNKKIKNTRQNGFMFIQINKLTIKIYSNTSNIILHYYSKDRIPITHQQFFGKLSQNRDYVQTHCSDLNIAFHFACHKWYLYDNPQC